MAAVTIRSDFGAQENKICHYFHFLQIRQMLISLIDWRSGGKRSRWVPQLWLCRCGGSQCQGFRLFLSYSTIPEYVSSQSKMTAWNQSLHLHSTQPEEINTKKAHFHVKRTSGSHTCHFHLHVIRQYCTPATEDQRSCHHVPYWAHCGPARTQGLLAECCTRQLSPPQAYEWEFHSQKKMWKPLQYVSFSHPLLVLYFYFP